MKKVVYFFCYNRNFDPVASSVFDYLMEYYSLQALPGYFDDYNIFFYTKEGLYFELVRTKQLIYDDYIHYLPMLNQLYHDYDYSGLINWHEGGGGEEKLFTAHTTGDPVSGNYGNTDSVFLRKILNSIENQRRKYQLEEFKTFIEATHWSGIPAQQNPELLIKFRVPLFDIEIGSVAGSWENQNAIQVLAEALLNLNNEDLALQPILCIGGMHFVQLFSESILNEAIPIGVSHILSNRFLEKGLYNEEGCKIKIENCIRSIHGGIKAIVYHDSLKANYKNKFRIIAEKQNIPLINKNILKDPQRFKEIIEIFPKCL